MKIKHLLYTLVTVATGSAAFAQDTPAPVFQEGFENVKVNNKGILYCPYIYPPTKLKEGEEYTYVRGKREVCAGKISLKMANMKEKGAYFLVLDKVIPICKADEYFVISVDVRGKGFVQPALINYTAKNKFVGTVGGSALSGKPGISLKKPLDTEEWTTVYFKCPRNRKMTDDGICKPAIFIYAKSEIYLDNIKIQLEKPAVKNK